MVAKGNENRSQFLEWSGIFDLANKKDIDISQCAFCHLEGTFNDPCDKDNGCAKPISPVSLEKQEMLERKAKEIHNADDDSRILPQAKRRRKNLISPKDQHGMQRERNACI